jgi:hypothetical protein
MVADSWKWKGKDGRTGGLLYEPGNWGDMLKLSWLFFSARWIQEECGRLDYFDPFAGQAGYPLGRLTRARYAGAALDALSGVAAFVERSVWPSAALFMRHSFTGSVTVFDSDPVRRASWRESGVTVAEAESGWQAAKNRDAEFDTLWLIDPYDILSEWRDALPLLVEKSRTVTVLVYIYNRSAGKPEMFSDYRLFRNRLDDALEGRPRLLGRAASDPFLPRAHHEMLLLPSARAAKSGSFSRLARQLETCTASVYAAQERAAVFDSI